MFREANITHPVPVNDRKPFDACKGFLTARKTDESATNENLELAQCIVIFQHAKALNPPIKVTQAVLDAIEKVPSAMFYVGEYGSSLETKYPLKRSDETYYTIHNARQDDLFGTKLQIGDYIQADCPLALQVLLGFTVKGVPKDA